MKKQRFTFMVLLLLPSAGWAQAPLPLIPYPEKVIQNTGTAELRHRIRFEAPGGTDLSALAGYTSDLLEMELGWRPTIVSGIAPPAGLTLRVVAPDSMLGAEGYRLSSQSTGVSIEASTEAGLFHGLQTFRQLLHAGEPGTVPRVEITDTPRFPYRGMHLDVARHFFPVAAVERYGDGIPYCGFYTQEEIRQVVAYAAARHITILPEIEMPGHARAALASYPELACTPGPFEVGTVWGVEADIFCPSEATFAFLEGVLTEVMALFPGPYIHVGGDEAPKARWKASDLAQSIIQREQLADEHALQSWFFQRIERFLSAHGRRLIGWDEIFEGGSPLAPPS